VIYKTVGDSSLIPIIADPNFDTQNAMPTHIISVSLPAGSYWITGKLAAQDTNPPSNFSLDCDVVNGSTVLDVEHGTLLTGIINNVPYSFEAPLTLAAQATITLQCDSNSQQTTHVQDVRLAAIQVQNLTQSP
jgi:hypothetical protein